MRRLSGPLSPARRALRRRRVPRACGPAPRHAARGVSSCANGTWAVPRPQPAAGGGRRADPMVERGGDGRDANAMPIQARRPAVVEVDVLMRKAYEAAWTAWQAARYVRVKRPVRGAAGCMHVRAGRQAAESTRRGAALTRFCNGNGLRSCGPGCGARPPQRRRRGGHCRRARAAHDAAAVLLRPAVGRTERFCRVPHGGRGGRVGRDCRGRAGAGGVSGAIAALCVVQTAPRPLSSRVPAAAHAPRVCSLAHVPVRRALPHACTARRAYA